MEQRGTAGTVAEEAVIKSELDIVCLMWVVSLMNRQADEAEAALVEYGKDPSEKSPLLECMWAVHQITSTLKILGMKKAELLTLEMERSLNDIYKDRISGERHKLVMGGLMQALKVLPAYFSHAQNVRRDTGRGLEPYVNNLRRWAGLRPKSGALFFYVDVSSPAGLNPPVGAASEAEVVEEAGSFLVLYLNMAKSALRGTDVQDGMKHIARIAYRMQGFFAGREPERFWFTLIGLCEGIAGGLITPDECIAQIFKTGAFLIKYAREHGREVDPQVDYDQCIQQMLFYIGSCRSRPAHISAIRKAFAVDEAVMEEATRALVHSDALMTALGAALERLVAAMEFLDRNDLAEVGRGQEPPQAVENELRDTLSAASYRLEAAGQLGHAEHLKRLDAKLARLCAGDLGENAQALNQAVQDVVRGVLDVKLDVEHKLEHGLDSTYSTREFELRETVARASFRQMDQVESHLQTILRRKALTRALARKPNDAQSLLQLTSALHRYLNKSDQGHEQLRQAVKDADGGDPDLDLLYQLAKNFLDELDEITDRRAIDTALKLLDEIAGAMNFSRLPREAAIVEQCRDWLSAASRAGSVAEDDALHCFANAFAFLELYLQRSIADPVGDNQSLLEIAETRAAELKTHAAGLAGDSRVTTVSAAGNSRQVEDESLSGEFVDIFIEESEEILAELNELVPAWLSSPQLDNRLREIRRHFHTLKGNGRVVGANVMGELGWAAQDLLDHVLDGDRKIDQRFCGLLNDIVTALPELIHSYRSAEGADVDAIRRLTNQCFLLSAQRETPAQDSSAKDDSLGGPIGVVTPQMPLAGPLGQ